MYYVCYMSSFYSHCTLLIAFHISTNLIPIPYRHVSFLIILTFNSITLTSLPIVLIQFSASSPSYYNETRKYGLYGLWYMKTAYKETVGVAKYEQMFSNRHICHWHLLHAMDNSIFHYVLYNARRFYSQTTHDVSMEKKYAIPLEL